MAFCIKCGKAHYGTALCTPETDAYKARQQADAAQAEAARMRLRDEFAMAALTGMAKALACRPEDDGQENARTARLSYELADAMLAAREGGK